MAAPKTQSLWVVASQLTVDEAACSEPSLGRQEAAVGLTSSTDYALPCCRSFLQSEVGASKNLKLLLLVLLCGTHGTMAESRRLGKGAELMGSV